MPYDISTPFGNIPGQVTPYEQLQAQTAARAIARASADDAHSAQMHMLRQSLGDDGGADSFFSAGGPFGTAPKETGAMDLAQHNTMVDRRQQGTAAMRDQLDLLKPPDYLTATDHGDMARGQFQLDKGQLDIQSGAQGALKDALQKMLGQGGAATPAGMNPNAQPGGPNVNTLVGGGNGSAGSGSGLGGGSDDELMRLAILQSIAGGGKGGGPDIGGILKGRGDLALKNREFDMKSQDHDLGMQKARMEMDQWKQQQAEQENLRHDPTAVSAKYPEVMAPLAQMVGQFVAQDTNMVGWDPTPQDLQAIVQERDRTAASLAKRGVLPDQALQEANRGIIQALGPNRNDLNSNMTRKLMAAIGMDMSQPAAPVAGPGVAHNSWMNRGL